MGHLTNFEFDRTTQLVEEMRFSFKETPLVPFLEQVNATALAHVAFCRGRLAEFDNQMEVVFRKPETEPAIEQSDRLGILRIFAARSFIFEDSTILNSIESELQEIIKNSTSPDDLFIWQTIRAMKFFLAGEYLQAFDAASLAEEIGQRAVKARSPVVPTWVTPYGPRSSAFAIKICPSPWPCRSDRTATVSTHR